MHLIHRKTCRACGSSALTRVIDLGEQFLQGSFLKPGRISPPLRRIPTSLVRCDPMKDEKACGLLQMEYTVPPEILYTSYWYRSGTNRTMREHLDAIAREAISLLGSTRINVLDIGCNDGTLLGFYPPEATKFGIDPSDVAQGIGPGATIVQGLFPSEELLARLPDGLFDVVTSIAMFYDLEDPIAFCRSVKQVLAPGGVWIIEMSYMPLMLQMTSYDTICHEHIEYYSLAVVEFILQQAGLRVVDASLNDINGGSIRCLATHTNNFRFRNPAFDRNLKDLRRQEFDFELDTDKPYRNFQDRINVHREDLNRVLKQLKRDGKTIHVYGASTKGNTILQWCGIDRKIVDLAAERNPDKFGATTLGTDVPIVSEEESRAKKPDYYLVLPWHFRNEILERERETIARGTGFIFPLPSVEIVRS
jgi:SAM-dependent methyltransferase